MKAITIRQDAIYYDLFPANQEHRILDSLPRMGSISRRVKEAVPGVVNVNVPVHAKTHCYISIKETGDAEVKKSAFAALATEADNLRFIVADGVPKGKSCHFSPLENTGIQTPCSI